MFFRSFFWSDSELFKAEKAQTTADLGRRPRHSPINHKPQSKAPRAWYTGNGGGGKGWGEGAGWDERLVGGMVAGGSMSGWFGGLEGRMVIAPEPPTTALSHNIIRSGPNTSLFQLTHTNPLNQQLTQPVGIPPHHPPFHPRKPQRLHHLPSLHPPHPMSTTHTTSCHAPPHLFLPATQPQ